jgi:hypothetical protein
MANAYVTAEEIRAGVVDGEIGAEYDAILTTLAERASREIDRATGRAPGAYYVTAAATARTFDAYGGSRLGVDEMTAAPTLVELDPTGAGSWTALAASDWEVWPARAAAQGYPYTGLRTKAGGAYPAWPDGATTVRVTAVWGFSATPPPDVTQAALILAWRWFRRGQQGFADTGAVVELGQLRYTQATDPEVGRMIAHLRRMSL